MSALKFIRFSALSVVVASSTALAGGLNNALVDDNLFDKWEATLETLGDGAAKGIAEQNAKLIKKLNAAPVDTWIKKKVAAADTLLVNQIYVNTVTHPVAATHMTFKYDPEGGIGFCFGRAMAAHFEALLNNVSPRAIKKLWAVGHMRTGTMEWQFHVTTIVRTIEGWLTIDPIGGHPQSLDAWYNFIRGVDVDGTVKLYVTEASKFGPSAAKYDPESLNDEFYNKYFSDLLKHTRERAKNLSQSKTNAAIVKNVEAATAP